MWPKASPSNVRNLIYVSSIFDMYDNQIWPLDEFSNLHYPVCCIGIAMAIKFIFSILEYFTVSDMLRWRVCTLLYPGVYFSLDHGYF